MAGFLIHNTNWNYYLCSCFHLFLNVLSWRAFWKTRTKIESKDWYGWNLQQSFEVYGPHQSLRELCRFGLLSFLEDTFKALRLKYLIRLSIIWSVWLQLISCILTLEHYIHVKIVICVFIFHTRYVCASLTEWKNEEIRRSSIPMEVSYLISNSLASWWPYNGGTKSNFDYFNFLFRLTLSIHFYNYSFYFEHTYSSQFKV